ncbi:alpha,alpha-trehalose-phosphate synthase [Panicum miliaceum]|uniref:Alpha,alpha-trehalose-phosphate synthase n=1 Tax=Panicum miliaceum TaxID=4540 RepID=A0A3L6QVX4_PANMI|nr:alpha,alpha-trehalose-phosphate synthase [Panicum miliaceum]
MVSRSYSNLLELASGGGGGGGEPLPSLGRRRVPRVVTASGIVPGLDASDDDDDDADAASAASDHSSHAPLERVIIVANQLPVRAARRPGGAGWDFAWDEDSLLLQVKDSLRAHHGRGDVEFVYVGGLRDDVPPAEHDQVAHELLEGFRCVPTFLPADLRSRFYHGFCKQQLWPLFHYMLPLSPELGGRFDRLLWQAYVSVNKIFADKILEVISPDEDFVWVHDYHLMVLPTFLRKRFNRVKLGFFLHSPFPSSEIFKTLPVREELLRSLLNADLIGFHTFDYARHFLSCCSRMLGLKYESQRGYIALEYYGRTVTIKILPVGVHLEQLQSVLNLPETAVKVAELLKQFNHQNRMLLLGVDDMDIFKGISLKLLAFEQLLMQHPEWRGRVVLVQIANPARGKGKDVKEVQEESDAMVKRINDAFGQPDYQPVILIDKPLQFYERMAYYVVAECCLVTAVRDGMNLIPYEYIIARQGNEMIDRILGLGPSSRKKSMLVVSEFIGCSPSLSGAIRVNPWNIDSVADAMDSALEMPEGEKVLRHEKHHRYVSTHDVGYWANSFLQDLERTCLDHNRRRCWGIGFGLKFRVVALDPNFKKLAVEHLVSAYRRTTKRIILLDYDGTLMPQTSFGKSPTSKTIDMLRRDAEWETCVPVIDCSWKQIAEPVMKTYTETTDGSTIEDKETAIVWSYEDADPDFGSCQAKELHDHLESVLSNEPVSVKAGLNHVEVKPQGVSKGLVAKRILSTMQERGDLPDFILCVGDDRSDEDMFEVIMVAAARGPSSLHPEAEVFACTVGRKPSKAKYYLDDPADIERLIQGLANVSDDQAYAATADTIPRFLSRSGSQDHRPVQPCCAVHTGRVVGASMIFHPIPLPKDHVVDEAFCSPAANDGEQQQWSGVEVVVALADPHGNGTVGASKPYPCDRTGPRVLIVASCR